MTFEKLIASYWLNANQQETTDTSLELLTSFAKAQGFDVSTETIEKAACILDGVGRNGQADLWVSFTCFMKHPHTTWNFMLDAMAVADNDEHLDKIAINLAEHILAHYGSMMPHFESMASIDDKFKRMLTGVWRHIMSDNVWARLRKIQSEVPDPLSTMIPLKNGIEYMAKSLKEHDRLTDDKGLYVRDCQGKWHRKPKPDVAKR